MAKLLECGAKHRFSSAFYNPITRIKPNLKAGEALASNSVRHRETEASSERLSVLLRTCGEMENPIQAVFSWYGKKQNNDGLLMNFQSTFYVAARGFAALLMVPMLLSPRGFGANADISVNYSVNTCDNRSILIQYATDSLPNTWGTLYSSSSTAPGAHSTSTFGMSTGYRIRAFWGQANDSPATPMCLDNGDVIYVVTGSGGTPYFKILPTVSVFGSIGQDPGTGTNCCVQYSGPVEDPYYGEETRA
jgi:hypothetical protein